MTWILKKIKTVIVVFLVLAAFVQGTKYVLYNVLFPQKYSQYVEQYSKYYCLNNNFVYAVIKAESGQKEMSHDLSFASAVAAYGMLLTDSAYKGTATYKMVEELAEAGITIQTDERNMAQASNDQLYRSQFLELVRKTEKIPQCEPAAQMWQCD